MKIFKKDLNSELVDSVVTISNRILNNNKCYVMFSWDETPRLIKELCNFNGGDEDFVLLTKNDDMPSWLERITDGQLEPDVYMLDDVTILVGSHS